MTLHNRKRMYLPFEKYQHNNANEYLHRQIILRNSFIKRRYIEWFDNNQFNIINNQIMLYNNQFKCKVIPLIIDLHE